MRMIDADATVQYLRRYRCADCDRRKGMKNGKVRFCYEIGDAPCRACDIGDTIDYFLDEAISPTIEAVPVVRCKDCVHFNTIGCGEGFGWCEGTIVNTGVTDTFFCAEGERKEEQKNG